ncbi:MAG: M28 family peptidase [Chitinophagaceae bacterium]|nr:M28 family peptidase [Chitinophagaceae bacterium]
MKSYLLFALTGMSLAAVAQKPANPKPYAATITAADLKKHLYIVASKEMEGRETATEGQRKAAAYIQEHFRALGLAPGNGSSYQQAFPVYRDQEASASIEVNGKELNEIFGARGFEATYYLNQVVFVGDGLTDSTHDSYKGLDVAGKAVLIMPGKPNMNMRQRNRDAGSNFAENARLHGAAVVLYMTSTAKNPMSRMGYMYTEIFKPEAGPNMFYVSEAVCKAIMGEASFKSDSAAVKNGNAQSKIYKADILLQNKKSVERLESTNVVGVLEGTDKKDEYLFLTAHYDHIGKQGDVINYGADDDGSGTVSILELAEAFVKAKKEGKGPRRTIVFMCVSGEEKGLWGSEYYSEHPLFPLDKTTADLNIDMIGRIDPSRKHGDSTNYVYVVGDDKLSSDLRPISESVNKKYTKLELDYKYNDPNDKERIYYRSDHYNFARKGVPIIFYFNGVHADYHRPSDTVEKIGYEMMAKRAQLVFYTAWEMANRDAMLKRDIPLPPMN